MQSAGQIESPLSGYAVQLKSADLDKATIHAAKTRIIDTLGALIGGFPGEPCHMTRELAARIPQSSSATVIGTMLKTSSDVAGVVRR